ncbi:MAG: hypothetical protein QM723_27635 [Myxococcaceae bacterium]
MKPLLDAKQVMAALNVPRATAYRIMKSMPHLLVGTRVLRVTQEALENYLKMNTRKPKWTESTESNPAEFSMASSTGPTGSAAKSAPTPSTRPTRSSSSTESSAKHSLKVTYPRTKPRN